MANKKALIFSYESGDHNELTIRLKPDFDHAINEDVIVFKKFNASNEYQNIFNELKSYCIFYLNISQFEYTNMSHCLMQECKRRVSGK